MSLYTNEFTTLALCFSRDDWNNFLKSIQTGCRFVMTLGSGDRTYDRTYRKLCDEEQKLRYYITSNDGVRVANYHISNDSRRAIVKFLKLELLALKNHTY